MNTNDQYYDRIRHALGALGDNAGPTPSFDDLTLAPVSTDPVGTKCNRSRRAVAAFLLAAATVGTFALATIAGNNTASVEVSSFSDAACSGSSSYIDEGPGCAIAASEFNSGHTNPVVFMEPTATAAQIKAIAEKLDTSREIVRYTYVDQQLAWDEFVEMHSDSPIVVEASSAADLPPSFRFELAPTGAQLLAELHEFAGTSSILSTIDGSYSRDPATETD